MRKPNKLAPFSEGKVPPNGKEFARAVLPGTLQGCDDYSDRPDYRDDLRAAEWVLYRLPVRGRGGPWAYYKVIRPEATRGRLGAANFTIAWNWEDKRLANGSEAQRLLPAVRAWVESVLRLPHAGQSPAGPLRRPPESFRELIGE